MRKNFVFLLMIVLLTAVGCAGITEDEEISKAPEETTLEQSTEFQWPTSSYSQLEGEVDRLQQLLADHNISYRRDPHPIDVAFAKAIEERENPYQTSGIVFEYAEIWKKEMEKYLGLLAETLHAQDKKKLDANQQKWESYIDGKNELDYEVVFRSSGGGSMMRDIAAGNYYDKYRNRTLFLEGLYRSAQNPGYQLPLWNAEN